MVFRFSFNTTCSDWRGAAMNINQLYEGFGITPAKFMPNETAAEFGRRVMSTSASGSGQKGVIYSTGSQLENVDINQQGNASYQLYSY